MDQAAKQVTVMFLTALSAMQEEIVAIDVNRDSKYQMVHVSAQPAQSPTVNSAMEHSAQVVSQGTQDQQTNQLVCNPVCSDPFCSNCIGP